MILFLIWTLKKENRTKVLQKNTYYTWKKPENILIERSCEQQKWRVCHCKKEDFWEEMDFALEDLTLSICQNNWVVVRICCHSVKKQSAVITYLQEGQFASSIVMYSVWKERLKQCGKSLWVEKILLLVFFLESLRRRHDFSWSHFSSPPDPAPPNINRFLILI